MSRIDCSKTLNYVAEKNRMCEDYFHHICREDDEVCPLYRKYRDGSKLLFSCNSINKITQEDIDAVQEWSDEHPQETMAEHFFKMFPNAPKDTEGNPNACVKYLGWIDKCIVVSCEDCWNRPYSEVTK